MSDALNDLMAALRRLPPDRDLSAIEALVWRRLDQEAPWPILGGRLSPGASLAAARMSLGALALLAGLLAGAAVAGQASPAIDELAVFSTEAPFGLASLLSRS